MACIAGDRGSPRMLRAPEGPRAEFHPPLEPADDLAVGQEPGDVLEQLGLVANRWPLPPCPARDRAICVGAVARAEEAALLSCPGPSARAAFPGADARRTGPPRARRRRRRPRAGSRDRRSRPRASSRPLATQLRATPPARTRCFMPVRSRTCRPIRSTTSSVTAWMLAARSMCRCSRGDSGARGGPPKSSWNRLPVMVSPWQYWK